MRRIRRRTEGDSITTPAPNHGYDQHQYATWKRNLYSCWFARFFVSATFQFMIPFIPLMLSDMGVPNSRIDVVAGMAISIPGFFVGLAAPFWGYMSDVFGHKIMMLRALFVAAVLFFLFSAVNTAPMFIVLRVLQGLGAGIIATSIALVSAGTPHRYQNNALRLLTTSNLFSSTFVPAVSGAIVLSIGFAASIRYGALLIVAVGITTFIVVREPIHKERRKEMLAGHARRKKEGKKTHYAPKQYRALLTGSVVISGILNLMRISPISMALLIILKFAPAEKQEFFSGVTMGCVALWALISAYTIPHIALKSARSRFSITACAVFVVMCACVVLLSLSDVVGYGALIALCACALGLSSGVDIVMQEVIGRSSYDEHKGKVFGRLTLMGGMGRFFGTMLISAVSGYLGTTAAAAVLIVLQASVFALLLYVRTKEPSV